MQSLMCMTFSGPAGLSSRQWWVKTVTLALELCDPPRRYNDIEVGDLLTVTEKQSALSFLETEFFQLLSSTASFVGSINTTVLSPDTASCRTLRSSSRG